MAGIDANAPRSVMSPPSTRGELTQAQNSLKLLAGELKGNDQLSSAVKELVDVLNGKQQDLTSAQLNNQPAPTAWAPRAPETDSTKASERAIELRSGLKVLNGLREVAQGINDSGKLPLEPALGAITAEITRRETELASLAPKLGTQRGWHK